jgi:mTERF
VHLSNVWHSGLQVFTFRKESLAKRVEFLISEVGLSADELASVITRMPSVLCLDVERNLQPKWQYLQHQLGGSTTTVARNPIYLNLSLSNRCCSSLCFF